MTKKGAPKTKAIMAQQEKHNRERREARAATAEKKRCDPRAGACEEVVHTMVGKIITRLRKRRRNNDTQLAALKSNPAMREASRARNERWRTDQRQEASERGITFDELLKERDAAHQAKPKTYYSEEARHKERMATDVAYETSVNLRTRLGEFMRLTNGTKAVGTMKLVGCTQAALIARLKKQLSAGEELEQMSIDHIFPMSLYDAADPLQQRMMMHWSNMQPMLLNGKEGNIAKNNKLPTKVMAAKVAWWAWPRGVTRAMLPDKYDGWSTPLRK